MSPNTALENLYKGSIAAAKNRASFSSLMPVDAVSNARWIIIISTPLDSSIASVESICDVAVRGV